MFDDSEHFIDALRASLAQPMHCRRQDAAESLPGVDEPLVLPSPEEEDVELSLAVEVSFALVVELVLPPPEP